ncbi:MAG: hypothetical protein OEW64_00340 [Gammaproteobacteria bacterium]|nr:hypothetical protein [Gammaproteobacteria bacterium]MDH5302526.1 hypothetical protein [Gammaproteobacteria bacterium]MDH5321926.1 hypothetical protein [Gammaproteobacteria bacterium]
MRAALLLMVSIAVLNPPAAAQQDDASAPTDAEEVVTESEPVAEPDPAVEPVMDDVFYQDIDDKDFRPSEDIPTDQSIPFPTDI